MGPLCADRFKRRNPIHPRSQLEVQQQNIAVRGTKLKERILARGAVDCDLDVGSRVQKNPETFPDDRMVVHKSHPYDFIHLGWSPLPQC